MARGDGPDRGELNGVGQAIRRAYPCDAPFDRDLEAEIARVDGSYWPDVAADQRMEQLLTRLKRLPWG